MKTRNAFFWSAFGQIYSFLINFIGSVIVARLLSPVEMGIYVIGAATVGFISAFTSLGVGAYVIRETELNKAVLTTAFTLNALLALGLSALILLLGQMSNVVLGSPEAGSVLTVLAITPALGVITFHPATLMQRDMQFKTIAAINAVSMTIGTATTIGCALSHFSYMSPAWGAVASAIVTLVGYGMMGSHQMSFSLGLTAWRPILAFGLRMVTITGVATMSARLADIILGRLQGLRALGIYSRASGLSNQIFDNVYGTATRVVFVHLSREYRETGTLKAEFLRSFRMITAVIWPCLFGLAILAPVVVYNLYGEQWISVAPPLAILLVAQIVALFFGMNWELFVIRDETALQTRIELIRSVLGLGVFAIGCTISLTAAAAGRLCDNLIALFMYRKHVARLSEATHGELNRVYGEGMLLSACAATPTAVLMIYERWSEHTPLLAAAIAVALGVVLWMICLFQLHHPLAHEARLLGRGLARRFARPARGPGHE